jgi:calcineurin-like phosphoesterase
MGMCGPKLSIIGDDKDMVIKRFRSGLFEPLQVSSDKNYILNGVILDLNENSNKIIRFSKEYNLDN